MSLEFFKASGLALCPQVILHVQGYNCFVDNMPMLSLHWPQLFHDAARVSGSVEPQNPHSSKAEAKLFLHALE